MAGEAEREKFEKWLTEIYAVKVLASLKKHGIFGRIPLIDLLYEGWSARAAFDAGRNQASEGERDRRIDAVIDAAQASEAPAQAEKLRPVPDCRRAIAESVEQTLRYGFGKPDSRTDTWEKRVVVIETAMDTYGDRLGKHLYEQNLEWAKSCEHWRTTAEAANHSAGTGPVSPVKPKRDHVHECGTSAAHTVCVCVVCGESWANTEAASPVPEALLGTCMGNQEPHIKCYECIGWIPAVPEVKGK